PRAAVPSVKQSRPTPPAICRRNRPAAGFPLETGDRGFDEIDARLDRSVQDNAIENGARVNRKGPLDLERHLEFRGRDYRDVLDQLAGVDSIFQEEGELFECT